MTAPESTEPTSGPAPAPSPATTEGFARDLERARKALAGLLGRLRRIRKEPVVQVVNGGVSSEEVVARLTTGLQREHEYVLGPLLGRLEEMSNTIVSGHAVPYPAIEEGLGLVDRYLHELHDVHIRLLEIAGIDPAKGEPARLAFQLLASDYEHARVRWATVRVLLHGYEERTPVARAMFALTLAQECRAELAWHDFEESYVKTSVPAMLPAKIVETWRVELEHARDAGRADRVRIEDWVSRTAPLVDVKK